MNWTYYYQPITYSKRKVIKLGNFKIFELYFVVSCQINQSNGIQLVMTLSPFFSCSKYHPISLSFQQYSIHSAQWGQNIFKVALSYDYTQKFLYSYDYYKRQKECKDLKFKLEINSNLQPFQHRLFNKYICKFKCNMTECSKSKENLKC